MKNNIPFCGAGHDGPNPTLIAYCDVVVDVWYRQSSSLTHGIVVVGVVDMSSLTRGVVVMVVMIMVDVVVHSLQVVVLVVDVWRCLRGGGGGWWRLLRMLTPYTSCINSPD